MQTRYISIHPPPARWDQHIDLPRVEHRISIHPPPARWDRQAHRAHPGGNDFNPPTSCEVGLTVKLGKLDIIDFNPPTSCEVGPLLPGRPTRGRFISIHPPPARWDENHGAVTFNGMKFQSTHLLRGGTSEKSASPMNFTISIHPPPARWDRRSAH